jgi:signal transduction histidine kinase
MATLPSKFAAAEQASAPSLQEHSNMMLNIELLDKLYEAVNEIILILNRQLQIVFCNSYFASLLGYAKSQDLTGMRPREALGCVHGCEIDGCGTSEFCSMCGATSAILNAQQGKVDVKECRILRGPKGDAMDLLVRATPLKFRGEDFTIFAATDITHEKRRSALERVFFHDLMNTAMAIKTLSADLGRAGPAKVSEISSSIRQAAQQLVEEISAQRHLMYAENNELSVHTIEMTSKALLSQVTETYESLAKMRNCELEVSPQTQNAVFHSDPRIVARLVGNMIKNALEACKEGERVTLASKPSKDGVSFSVHNPGHMPREVQLQLFKRSFTTKGTGRGLGTYSMKLLTERYLKGRIAFTSSETDGTTFTVTLYC